MANPPLTLVPPASKPNAGSPAANKLAREEDLKRQREQVRDDILALLKGTNPSATRYRRLVMLDYTLTVELEGATTAQKLISGHAQAVTFITGKAGHFAEGEVSTNWDAKLDAIKQTSKTSAVVQDVSAQFVPAFAQEECNTSVAQDTAVPVVQASNAPVAQDRKRIARVAQHRGGKKPKLPAHWCDHMTSEMAWDDLKDADFATSYAELTQKQKRACAYIYAAEPAEWAALFSWPPPNALKVSACDIRKRLKK